MNFDKKESCTYGIVDSFLLGWKTGSYYSHFTFFDVSKLSVSGVCYSKTGILSSRILVQNNSSLRLVQWCTWLAYMDSSLSTIKQEHFEVKSRQEVELILSGMLPNTLKNVKTEAIKGLYFFEVHRILSWIFPLWIQMKRTSKLKINLHVKWKK